MPYFLAIVYLVISLAAYTRRYPSNIREPWHHDEKPGLAAGFFIANRKAVPKRLVQYFATIGAGGGVKSNL